MRIRALVLRRAKRPTACSAAELLAAHSTVDLERERDAGRTEEVLRHHGQRFVRGELRRHPGTTRCSRRLRARLTNGLADIGKCVTFSIRWSEIHWSRWCESRAGHEAGHATVPLRKTNPTNSASPLLRAERCDGHHTTNDASYTCCNLQATPATGNRTKMCRERPVRNAQIDAARPERDAFHRRIESARWHGGAKGGTVSRDQFTHDRAPRASIRASMTRRVQSGRRMRSTVDRGAGERETGMRRTTAILCGEHKHYNHC